MNEGTKGGTGAAAGKLPAEYLVIVCLVFLAAVVTLFLAAPSLDLWVSGLFYREDGGFFLRKVGVLRALRASGDIAVFAVVAWLVAQVAIKLSQPERRSLVPPGVTLFLLSTLIVGPLLIVNILLKNTWGRPRPTHLEVFGGDAPFVPIWQVTSYCDTNCSFVGGEASTATWLVAVALVVPRALRLPTAIALGIYAALLSLNRIAFGGHFLSDVLISIGLTLVVVTVGYRLIVTHPPAFLANERLEAGLTRLGQRLKRRGGAST